MSDIISGIKLSSSINLPTLKAASMPREISVCISASFFWINCFDAKGALNWLLSRTYSRDFSQQNSAAPITPQAIPYRAELRQVNGPLKLWTSGSTLSSGTNTWSIKIIPVAEARSANLPSRYGVSNPFESLLSKINPLKTPCSSFAQIINKSAIGELVIQVFEPVSSYPPLTFLAIDFIPAGSDPASGSVNPKHPIIFPLAISGIKCSFCCSEPNLYIAYIASEDWTLNADR